MAQTQTVPPSGKTLLGGITRLNRRKRLSLASLLLLWIPAGLTAAAILLPVGYLVFRALGPGVALGSTLSARSLQILGNSLLLAGSVTLASLVLALPTAWLTVRTDLPFKRIWAVLTALPLVIPSYIAAYLMASSLGPRGLFQGWLEIWFGVERLPSIYGFPGALLVLTVIVYPNMLLTLRASLAGSDRALEEAARSLGMTAAQTFWKVTLPQLRPGIAAGSLLVSLYVLQDFGAVAIMRYNTFTRAIYTQYQSAFNRQGAAWLALVLIVVTLLILAVEAASARRRVYSASTVIRPPALVNLGRWKIPALLFLSGLVLFALVMPAGVLVYWLVRGVQAGEQITNLWPALRNSLFASGLAAGAALLVSLPISVLKVRRPGRFSGLLERLVYLGYALPGVVVALALVFFGANYLPILYQTLPLLVFAYVILFLPQATGAVQASLVQLPKNLEEAGRSLGQPTLSIFRRVTLPLIQPGLGSGAALVFLSVMKELPATLLLGPNGFRTLSTTVWTFVTEAFFAKAAAPALLLILAASVPMAILVIRKRL